MVTVWIKRETRRDGSVCRKVYAHVARETLSPLDVITTNVPVQKSGHLRTGVRVRVNRSGEWAVWSCVDVPVVPKVA